MGMDTAIHLLMRDGPIGVAFSPHLSAEQYADLLNVMKTADTKAELRDVLTEASRRWGVLVTFGVAKPL